MASLIMLTVCARSARSEAAKHGSQWRMSMISGEIFWGSMALLLAVVFAVLLAIPPA